MGSLNPSVHKMDISQPSGGAGIECSVYQTFSWHPCFLPTPFWLENEVRQSHLLPQSALLIYKHLSAPCSWALSACNHRVISLLYPAWIQPFMFFPQNICMSLQLISYGSNTVHIILYHVSFECSSLHLDLHIPLKSLESDLFHFLVRLPSRLYNRTINPKNTWRAHAFSFIMYTRWTRASKRACSFNARTRTRQSHSTSMELKTIFSCHSPPPQKKHPEVVVLPCVPLLLRVSPGNSKFSWRWSLRTHLLPPRAFCRCRMLFWVPIANHFFQCAELRKNLRTICNEGQNNRQNSFTRPLFT